jgi:hypothetical protein
MGSPAIPIDGLTPEERLTCLRSSRAERAAQVKALDAGLLRRFLAASEVACARIGTSRAWAN